MLMGWSRIRRIRALKVQIGCPSGLVTALQGVSKEATSGFICKEVDVYLLDPLLSRRLGAELQVEVGLLGRLLAQYVWIWFRDLKESCYCSFTAGGSGDSQCCLVVLDGIIIYLLVLMNPSLGVLMIGAVQPWVLLLLISIGCSSIEESNNVMECLPGLFGR
ncbi:hypothetical protein ACOSP7_008245 [Xanthoceras sorbifolium]